MHPRGHRSVSGFRALALGLALAATISGVGAQPVKAGEALGYGSEGRAVERLQKALRSQTYPTGKIDGRFGYKTLQSVYAFEKVHGLPRDGVVSDAELEMIEGSITPSAPDRAEESFIDVDISKQIALEVVDGSVIHTISVSSGSEEYYTQSGTTQKAHTPRGRFQIDRKIEGWRHAELGDLYYPSYFHEGYAFHGSESVPPYPASHGCVRLPMYVAKRFFDRTPIGRVVYIHG